MASASSLPDAKIARRLENVKHIILVLSGKGGVGKSSVSTQLALSLCSSHGASRVASRVGLLDIDLTGPSIPRMLGLDGQSVRQSSDGWVPVYADREQRLAVMSTGFLLRRRNDSVVWRGPKKNAMIKQFLGDVRWGELDYLIVDTPPGESLSCPCSLRAMADSPPPTGTSDEHISLLEYLHSFSPSAVMVTTPQAISLADNLRSLDFTRKVSLPLLGLVENMSGYVCPHCSDCTNVWGRGGGEALAIREGIKFLGRIPIDPGLVRVLDDAKEEEAKAEEDLSQSAAGMQINGAAVADGEAKTGDTVAAESTVPAGTKLSRTILQRYRDSQTFPIFQDITDLIVEAVQTHAASTSAAAQESKAQGTSAVA